MKDLSSILHSLGFLDSEIKTYGAALEHGPSTVIDLTKHTHLSRQATYVVIDQLTKRGLMSSVVRGKKKYYVAEDPEKLLSYAQRREVELKERIHDLEKALPELRLKVGGEKPIVKLFEGKEAARAVLADIAEAGVKEVCEFSDIEAMYSVMKPDDIAPFLVSLKKNDTYFNGIYAGEPRGKTLRSTRYFFPKDQGGFGGEVSIYNDKVSFITYEGKIYCVFIENKTLANTMKRLFELAMKGAKAEGLKND